MDLNKILSKIYKASSIVIGVIVLSTCILCKWPLITVVIALLASIVISSPALISLQILVWLFQRIKFGWAFLRMPLFSLIPLLSFIVALLFAGFVPGKIWFVLLIGILSGYTGLFKIGISISQFFNSSQNEREKKPSRH